MSNKSNDQGRAFEYACIIKLHNRISEYHSVVIDTASVTPAKTAWEKLTDTEKQTFLDGANAFINTLFSAEPNILENDNSEPIVLKIQKDDEGEKGDVRDILIIKVNANWEIGLSVKHNHFAVKHSRLSSKIDFGDKWYNIPCSQNYWDEIEPIFNYLENEKLKKSKWSELPNKEKDVYLPLLTAFINEIKLANSINPSFPKKMVEYLLGKYDFYKVIAIDSKKITNFQSFNLRGTLNKATKTKKPNIIIPIASLPDELISIRMKPNSSNTVELYLNNGWQFSFRIHNASTKVETSLKFDIQFTGMPTEIILISCNW